MAENSTKAVEQAADAITGLINSRVQSPTRTELVAILSESLAGLQNGLQEQGAPAEIPAKGPSAQYAKWRTLIAEWDAATEPVGGMDPHAPGYAEAEAANDAALEGVFALQHEMWKIQAADWDDIGVLAQLLFRTLWGGCDLHAPDADALMGSGPHSQGGACDTGIAALLKGIRDVMRAEAGKGRVSQAIPPSWESSPPTSGTVAPAYLGDLAHWDGVVRQYLAFHDDAAAPAGESLEDNTKRYDRAGDALCAETEAVWAKPVRDWGDAILRAAVAVHWNSPANVGDPPYPQNVLRLAVKDDPYDGYDVHAVAHVIRGVLDLAGLRFDQDGRLLSMEASNG